MFTTKNIYMAEDKWGARKVVLPGGKQMWGVVYGHRDMWQCRGC